MPRIRTVKPEFWGHPVMARLPDCFQLVALATLNLADDEGYFLADPALVKSFARPFDKDHVKVESALCELTRIGWMETHPSPTHGTIGRVVNLLNQPKNKRPQVSKLKNYCVSDSSVTRQCNITDSSVQEQGTGNREQGREQYPPTPQGGKRRRLKESLFVIDQEGDAAAKHWYAFCVKTYPTKDKGNNRAKNAHEERTINRDSVQAQANFKAILDSGKATARELASCVDVASQRWAKDLGYEYQFIPNLSTYFGPEKSLWLNDLATARRQLEQIDQREDTV